VWSCLHTALEVTTKTKASKDNTTGYDRIISKRRIHPTLEVTTKTKKCKEKYRKLPLVVKLLSQRIQTTGSTGFTTLLKDLSTIWFQELIKINITYTVDSHQKGENLVRREDTNG